MPLVDRPSRGGGGTWLAVGCSVVAVIALVGIFIGLLGFAGFRSTVRTVSGPGPTAIRGATGSGGGSWGTSNGMDRPIPDGDPAGYVHPFDFDASPGPAMVKGVKVKVELTHPRPEDLEIRLTDPNGTEQILRQQGTAGDLNAEYPPKDNPDLMSPFKGKSPVGKWKLTIRDKRKGEAGRITSAGLDVDYSF